MNGFADHGLDENAFGEKKGFSEGIKSFDAFRKCFQTARVTCFLMTPSCAKYNSKLTVLTRSQNQTYIHPAELYRRLHYFIPHHNQHIAFLYRAPALVLGPRDPSFQR